MNTQRPERLALLPAATAFLLVMAASPALATGGNIFVGGGGDPLQAFVSFMTGPFAYAIVILAALAAAASLAYGGDFSGWSRRFLIVAAAGGIVIMAENVVQNLFGASRAFSVPPEVSLQAWPWPDGAETSQ